MGENKTEEELKHFEELRKNESFKYSDTEGCYYAVKYSDVDMLLKSDNITVDFPFRASRQLFGKTILDSDDEGSILIRKNLLPFFSKKAIDHYRELIIRPCIKSILNESVGTKNEDIDFNLSISQRIPTQIIISIFGIDLKYEKFIYSKLEKLVLYLDHPSNSFQEAMEAKKELLSFLNKCINNEIEVNKNGFLSSISRENFQNKDEMLSTCLMLLVAGMATTIASLNSLIIYIYKYEQYLKANYEDVEKMKIFVNEVIRLQPAVRETIRFVKEDFDYKGVSFSEHDMLKIVLASANRDEEKFPNPNEFEYKEKRSLNCSFGKGKHFCIGSDLAIEELVVFIQEFLPYIINYSVKIVDSHEPEGTVIRMFKKIQLKIIN